jgi:GT2 family glycosyltransferase
VSTTVAVVNWNSGPRLRNCIDSIFESTPGVDVLVVDNASTDDSLERVLGLRDRVNFVRNSTNRGFASAVNQAFAASTTAYVLLLNPDVIVSANAISILEDFMNANPRAGAAGGWVNEKYLPRPFPTAASLIREDLGISSALHSQYHRGSEAVAVDQPAAAALLVRRDAYDEIGGLDERFFPAWYEDVDFCLRLRLAGWDIYFVPRAEFIHEGGYTAAALGRKKFVEAYYRNQLRYVRKHMGAAAAFAVRAAIGIGMAGRMIARPRSAPAYGQAMLGAIYRW